MKTFVLSDGTIAKMGCNQEENWKLIGLEEVQPDFYWFHLSAFPSGHLVLFSSEPTEENFKECRRICKDNSRYKNHRGLEIDCTQIRNLQKTEKVGEVEFISRRKVRRVL